MPKTIKRKSKEISKSKNNKNTTKTKKTPSYCAPDITNTKNIAGSCFNRDALIKIVNAWNNEHSNNVITFNKRTSNKQLWNKINEKMKKRKCNKEWCWVQQDFIKSKYNIKDDKRFDVFRPLMPSKWNENPREWLNTLDIQDVMEQYEDKYKDFKFIGPVPIDFDEKLSFGQCVVNELCNINAPKLYKNGIRKIGIIFNLDKHNQSGSHWIAMMCDMDKSEISYWDSYGMTPPKEVSVLMKRLKEQSKSINKKMKININKVRHQYKNTECGVYCINFLVNLLEGKTFKQVTNKIISDDKMFSKRNKYFIKA